MQGKRKNVGKAFEEDFKKSIGDKYFCYRLRDGTGNFNGAKNENVRFQATNICDFIVMAKDKLFLLELKSHAGMSIPFSCIRKNQIEELSKIEHDNVKAYFLFNFRDCERTYAIKAKLIKEYMEKEERQSFPIRWCIENGIEIPGEKKRTRFRYDLENFLEG